MYENAVFGRAFLLTLCIRNGRGPRFPKIAAETGSG
jgi:hypothetical protein